MQDYSWTDIRCPFEKRRDAACVFWDNVVYILGGSQLFPIKRMDCYNVVKDSWYSKLGPPTPRDSLAACAAEGKIYTSGGSEVGKTLKIFKNKPPKSTNKDTWKMFCCVVFVFFFFMTVEKKLHVAVLASWVNFPIFRIFFSLKSNNLFLLCSVSDWNCVIHVRSWLGTSKYSLKVSLCC